MDCIRRQVTPAEVSLFISHVLWIYSWLSLLVQHQGHPPLLTRASSADKTQRLRPDASESAVCISIHTLLFRSDRSIGTGTGVRPRECHLQLDERRRFRAQTQKTWRFECHKRQQTKTTPADYVFFLFCLKQNNNIKIKPLKLLLQPKDSEKRKICSTGKWTDSTLQQSQ